MTKIEVVNDECGQDAHYEDWLWGCRNPELVASNGERVTTALALRIATDVMRGMDPEVDQGHVIEWDARDLKLARAAISGVRAQAGCFGPDADEMGRSEEGLMLTEVCDIAVYG